MNEDKANTRPLVSVRLMTYNHEDFIADAMDGIMMQKTNFDVEVVVGDDFSTDNTLNIIRSYKDSKNIKIRILERKKGDEYWHKRQEKGRLYNFINILENCKGKYIALLDGDDYWTDPLKLQRQVDYLELNRKYVLSYTNCDIYLEKENTLNKNTNNYEKKIDLLNYEEIFNDISNSKLKIKTPTIVIKSKYVAQIEIKPELLRGDIPLLLTYSQCGQIHYLNKSTAVYRFSSNTASRPNELYNKIKFQITGCLLRFYFYEKYNYKIPVEIISKYQKALIDYSMLSKNKDFIVHDYLSEQTLSIINENFKRSSFMNKILFFLKNSRKVIGHKRQNIGK